MFLSSAWRMASSPVIWPNTTRRTWTVSYTHLPELMPLPISLAHKLAKRLTEVRKNGTLDYLRPDGKSQVTVEYQDGKPVRVDAVVISSQHSPAVSQEQLHADIRREVIEKVIPAELLDENTKYYICLLYTSPVEQVVSQATRAPGS